MVRALVIALAVVCLLAPDVDAARRGGPRARWAARRAARARAVEVTYSTPQAAWNAYYGAAIRHDWDEAFRCLDRKSRKQAVASAVFALLWFSSDDGSAGAVADISRRHRLDFAAMTREFNESYNSRMAAEQNPSDLSFEGERIRAFLDVQASLVRRIPDHVAFYRDAMDAIMTTMTDDEAQKPESRRSSTDAEDAPKFTEVCIMGHFAKASYPTGSVEIDGTELQLAQSVEFTFEDGGWRIHSPDW